jgi:hypothetical protein
MPKNKPTPKDGYRLIPTAEFCELMWECEDDSWTWTKFCDKVEAHFDKHPENKGKSINLDSVLQKCKTVNEKLLEAGGELVDMPFPQSNRTDWDLMVARRRKRKS